MDNAGLLADLAKDEPDEVLIAISIKLQEMNDSFQIGDLLTVSQTVAKEDGLNVLRLMQEHPDVTSEYFGIDASTIPENLVEKFDRLAE